MDYKQIKTDTTAVTRNVEKFYEQTGNIYETVVILSKRANQIAQDLKQELEEKISDFTMNTETLEEVSENHERIEIVRYYEKLPKPTLLAIHEYLNGQIYFRNPHKEEADKY
jgi:DNA-directed RNA polymerase subunit K/omega